MAIYKCKMCGGTLEVQPGESICECEYCGTKQTIPSVMEENLQNLFNRANLLRMKAEFDKAAEIYERIVQADESEAEAYWGLVLCKYGVEYVEDPATFKRIPTCHRTSYEAVTADADYRGAIEHADASQRQIYEAEAKTIDEIQKGILAVAKKESPYDVFICYKEADENGKRTVDSTIANDIYYQLTQEGFKVFYSAITLEDKLGEEYEPYIFSALNSAKVMLVLGTKPEYFTAVWVKNEWSRFLKLMQNDRSRTLIPCYRDMDAYELPEEFAHLQAQDMAKIGFISDIIRGIKKLIAKPEENTNAAPAAPVAQAVAQSGNANVDALVKRGNMALEDQDWEKANEFFDRALDLDAECAAAYLGRALVSVQFSSLAEWAKSLDPGDFSLSPQTLQAGEADAEAESRIVSENRVPGYLDKINWKPFDFSFSSVVPEWVSAKDFAETQLEENKNLNRAEQYGGAALRQRIDDFKNAVLAAYDQKIAEAEQQDEARTAEIQSKYADFLQKQEETAKEKRQKAEEKREADYQEAIADFNQAKNLTRYCIVRNSFTGVKLRDYKESAEYAEKCNGIIAEKEKRKKRRNRLIVIITVCAAAIAVTAALLITQVFLPRRNYNDAVTMLDDGQYEDAIEMFTELGDYRDSEDMIREAQNRRDYAKAEELLAEGSYVQAIEAFYALGNYEDADQRALAIQREQYALADEYLTDGAFEEAIDIFTALSDYEDSGNKVVEAQNRRDYEAAVDLLESGDYFGAISLLNPLGDFENARALADEAMTHITVNGTIAIGDLHTVGLNSDGTVVATGVNSSGQCDVSDWTDIVAISVGTSHTVGLKSDGTVVATGDNNSGQCEVSGWSDIVAVSAGKAHTVGLKLDGTVVATGGNGSGECDVSDWIDVIAVSAGSYYTVGLKSDGTVVAAGNNSHGECDVSEWIDIIAVSAGVSHTVGLKSDGTVVATGGNTHGQCDVSDWTDIIAVSAGSSYTVGLKSDGTVVATGNNSSGQCDVSDWTDIVAISVGTSHTVGLKSDGTVLATGQNYYGQCEVSDWSDILVP